MLFEMSIDAKVEAIQPPIPLGLMQVEEELQQEVASLVGTRHSRTVGRPTHVRWGRQPGSVYLGDQKFPTTVPRVRDRRANTEIPLDLYRRLQTPRGLDEGLILRVLRGISCRSYRTAAETIPEAMVISAVTVSRRFIEASSHKLKQLLERDLSGEDFVALLLDGKAFGKTTEMLTGVGITIDGRKIVLGFVETATENETACAEFLR